MKKSSNSRFAELGTFLKTHRLKKGVAQSELAKKFGFTAQFISNWENGKSSPPLNILPDLCDILDIEQEDMMNIIITQTQNELRTHFSSKKKSARGA